MSAPTYPHGTVTGTYTRIDDRPENGYVVFEPVIASALGGVDLLPFIVDAADNRVLVGSVEVRVLGGTFTVNLPATDTTALSPAGFLYRAKVLVGSGAVREVIFELPEGVSVDLTAVVSAEPGAPTFGSLVTWADFTALQAQTTQQIADLQSSLVRPDPIDPTVLIVGSP